MEKGQLRCDVNISLKPKGSEKLGTKVELKNINSFRFIVKAIEYEIERQSKLLKKGEKIVQETRLFDPNTGKTYPMRTKEEAHDYRYFPDPDLLPVVIKDEEIQQIKNSLPELPDQKYHRYIEKLGLPEYDAEVLTSDKALANYFEKVIEIFPQNPKLVANWILNELLGKLNEKGLEIENSPISPNSLAELLSLIADGTISGKIAKDVFEIAFETQKSPKQIVEEKGLKQISNEDEIRKIVKDILAKFPAEVEKYKSGNEKILGFLIGQVMKETKGKANPQLVNKIMKEELQ
jgi:aspartyl-tRNA(Asn)/glutamyl-tRNA(Gln) amidotransferase subunit B